MRCTLQSLQIGKGWLPEQGGNGLDRVFHALCRHLPEAGVKVDGLVAGAADVAGATDGRVRTFADPEDPLPHRLAGARSAAKARAPDADLAACHFALYGAPALDVLAHLPTVVHFHGPWAAESAAEGEARVNTWIKARVESSVYRTGDRFIVLSDAFRQVLQDAYGVPGDRIHIVPGGVDAERFHVDASPRAARERLNWPTDRPLLLSVRRLARRMGLPRLINAMDYVTDHHPEALLLIAGTGPLRAPLADRIRTRGLDDNVRLLGYVPDDELPTAYRAADLSVVPTVQHEGFGLITIESLAAGTPVLVTPVGGLPETVDGLTDELVLPDASTGALKEGLTAALNGTLALPDAAACRTYARTNYDWSIIAEQVCTVYEQVL